MTSRIELRSEVPVAFQDYRAPRQHHDRLIEPSIADAGRLVSENRAQQDAYPDSIATLRDAARTQLIRDARRYTSAYRDVDVTTSADRPVVMAGHQPALFHPGVWFKNFALHRIASDLDAIAVNLVVDSDVAPASSVRVPQLNLQSGAIGFDSVRYDRRGSGVPYEQALIEDRETFDAFDTNVARSVAGIVDDPLVRPLWHHAREAINRCGYAGCALAQARHRLESDLGLQTLEIPQSVVCRGEAFGEFVMHILRDLPRFHQCYNDSTEIYRRAHGIRSNAHPVPNLRRSGDWYEAPLWLYGNRSPKRRSVWVRNAGPAVSAVTGQTGSTAADWGDAARIEISDRDGRSRTIDCDVHAGEAFAALASPEFKVRSRALLTTMYARLVLSDLFLHGIGGGKYDQLGDSISRAFWGIQPPHFMVMSATVLLPGFQDHSVAAIDSEIARRQRQLRDIRYQAERFAGQPGLREEWVAEKQALLSEVPPKGRRYHWFRRVVELNSLMSASLDGLRREVSSQRQQLLAARREATIWNSREHSFCVYPLQYLTDAYDAMLPSGTEAN